MMDAYSLYQSQSQGAMPWFMDVLFDKYTQHCGANAVQLTAVNDFVQFVKRYLDTYRPSELFHADANYGIKLTNGDAFFFAPVTANAKIGPGGMQESVFVTATTPGAVSPNMQAHATLPVTGSYGG